MKIVLVIKFVGATLITSLVMIGILAALKITVPDVLQNIAVGSLTGLVGLLVKSDSPGEDGAT